MAALLSAEESAVKWTTGKTDEEGPGHHLWDNISNSPALYKTHSY